MAVTFILDHPRSLDVSMRWLHYSHGSLAYGDVPKDRPVVSNWQDPVRPSIRMAAHYFLSDFAHNLLSQGYRLEPLIDQQWELVIRDRAQAATFKLVFM